jgi:hypothetical protein
MAGQAVETLLYLLDEAFAGGEQSLISNVRSLTVEDWSPVPPGGSRSAYDMVWHVASCKLMYDHYAFGERVWTWPEMESAPYEGGPPYRSQGRTRSEFEIEALLAWLNRAQAQLRTHVAGLHDDDLLLARPANWGKSYETLWLIKVMIEHDLYHAGEVNHLRSLIHGKDRWAHEAES